MNTDTTLTIQQVAAATGLTEHTLRYYERVGLIHPIDRAHSGHRRYRECDVGWIEFLLKLRNTGMSIQQMQQYAHLQRQGDSTLPARVEMLKTHFALVQAQLETLMAHQAVIRFKIDYYSSLLTEAEGPVEAALS